MEAWEGGKNHFEACIKPPLVTKLNLYSWLRHYVRSSHQKVKGGVEFCIAITLDFSNPNILKVLGGV